MTPAGRSWSPHVAELVRLAGGESPAGTWLDYRSLGLSAADIPDLVEVMADRELNQSPDPAEHWAPLHAWRALGQLAAVEAVQPLIDLRIDLDDDYLAGEFPRVMASIGAPAIPALAAALARDALDPIVRGAMAEAIGNIGEANPSVASDASALLADRLERYPEHTAELNSLLVGALIDLRAVEHADVIGRAMTAGPIDEMFCGDWEDVQIELGLLSERITPGRRHLADRVGVSATPPSQPSMPSRERQNAKRKAKRKLAKASRRRNRR